MLHQCVSKTPQYTKYPRILVTFDGANSLTPNTKKQFLEVANGPMRTKKCGISAQPVLRRNATRCLPDYNIFLAICAKVIFHNFFLNFPGKPGNYDGTAVFLHGSSFTKIQVSAPKKQISEIGQMRGRERMIPVHFTQKCWRVRRKLTLKMNFCKDKIAKNRCLTWLFMGTNGML